LAGFSRRPVPSRIERLSRYPFPSRIPDNGGHRPTPPGSSRNSGKSESSGNLESPVLSPFAHFNHNRKSNRSFESRSAAIAIKKHYDHDYDCDKD
jgi:hypothetical protein